MSFRFWLIEFASQCGQMKYLVDTDLIEGAPTKKSKLIKVDEILQVENIVLSYFKGPEVPVWEN